MSTLSPPASQGWLTGRVPSPLSTHTKTAGPFWWPDGTARLGRRGLLNTEREADFCLPSLMRQNSPAATKRTGRRTPPPGYGRQNSPSVLRQNGPSVTILLQTINSFFFCMSVCMISFIQVGSIKFLPRTCQSLRPIYRCDKMSTNRNWPSSLSEIHFLDEGKEEEKSTLEVLWNE